MRMYHMLRPLLILSFLVASLTTQSQVEEASIPSWVQRIEFEQNGNPDQNPFLYLLVDDQENVSTKEHFTHRVIEFFTDEGVQEMSKIEVEYDPAYQELLFHEIKILRDRSWQKIPVTGFSVIQRESESESSIYDGHFSAIRELEDVRVGDVLEFSYTIKGRLPLFGDHYFSNFTQNFDLPIRRFYREIHSPKPLKISYEGGASEAKLISDGNDFTYQWDKLNVPRVDFEENAPEYVRQYQFVSLSSMTSWDDVGNWFAPLFRMDKSSSNKILKKYKELGHSTSDITDVIRFVQDKVRYVGLESGIGAYQPSSPLETMSRRFGDCKDKSFLLVTLLNGMGYDAFPVLVHSSTGETLRDRVPSPIQFNHCIVGVNQESKIFYVDPTFSNQGGEPNKLYTPNYGFGLNVSKDTSFLSKVGSENIRETDIEEVLKVDSIGGGGHLSVRTTYRGASADKIRRSFSRNSLSKIKQNYTEFYGSLFPNIICDTLIYIDSLRNSTNEILVHEEYSIPELWSETDGVLYLEYKNMIFKDYVSFGTVDSLYDLDIGVKNSFKHEIRFELPEKWRVENSETQLSGSYFEYSYKVRYVDSTIILTYNYDQLQSNVPAQEVESFLTKIENIQEDIYFTLTYDKSKVLSTSNSKISGFVLAGILISSLIGLLLVSWLIFFYDPPPRTVGVGKAIGGWLVLPAIGICLAPLTYLFGMYEFWSDGIFSQLTVQSSWEIFKDDRPLIFLIVWINIVCGNVILFFYSMAVAYLFFKKRSSVPNLIIIFYLGGALFFIMDGWISQMINPEETEWIPEAIGLIFKCAIWVPYFLLSERVKSTFTNTLDDRLPVNHTLHLEEAGQSGLHEFGPTSDQEE